jgi:hypothetical protein
MSVMLAESKYQRIVLETFNRLCTDVSSGLSESDVASALVTFLDLGKTEILTRNLKRGQTRKSTYFEAWCKRLHIATPAEHRQHVSMYLGTTDGRLLLPYLDELFEAASEIGIKWDRAEVLLRESLLNPKLRRKQFSPSTKHFGERNKDVAARRAVLAGMGAQKKDIPHSAVCRKFDFESITVPERWIQKHGVDRDGKTRWQQALKRCPNLVRKLISTDIRKIRDRNR